MDYRQLLIEIKAEKQEVQQLASKYAVLELLKKEPLRKKYIELLNMLEYVSSLSPDLLSHKFHKSLLRPLASSFLSTLSEANFRFLYAL